MPGRAAMLQHSVLLFKPATSREDDPGYDVIALRNIERLEQLKSGTATEGE
jgi:hypothetical protein